jgi:large subunit ribosomal protein L15
MPSRTKKFRGSRTHGRGWKAGRGKGKRGGTGNAGGHKHHWVRTMKYHPLHFGVHGFKRPAEVAEDERTINVQQVEESLTKLLAGGHAKSAAGKTEVDLGAAGYDKLLGGGRVTRSLSIKVPKYTERAQKKVESVGGHLEGELVVEKPKGKAAASATAKSPGAPPPPPKK